MGDASLSGESIALNFDAANFFNWWLRYEVAPELGHGVTGSLPDVIPFVRFGNRPGDISWSAAFSSILTVMHSNYADLSAYSDLFEAYRTHMGEVSSQATQAGGLGKLPTPYGDWCPPPVKMGGGQGPKPSPPLTSAFSYTRMVQQGLALATAAKNATEAARLSALAKQLLADYNAAFYRGNGTYDHGSQTALALGLALGASPDTPATVSALLTNLHSKAMHYDTGIIGFRYLFDALEAAGKHDDAMRVLMQTTYPSIGFYFANTLEQATTNLWELPDALQEGIGMNSRNHHMWSSYSAYLVKTLGGISQPAGQVGFQRLEFRPSSAYALHAANVSLDLPFGMASLKWVRSGGVQIEKVSEGHDAHLSCGAGGKIVSVEWASFGRPFHSTTGPASAAMDASTATEGWQLHRECHAARSVDVVASACVGAAHCTLRADRSTFSMSSAETQSCAASADGTHSEVETLRLWVGVRCEAPDAVQAHVVVPPTATATLVLPVRKMSSPQLTRSHLASGDQTAAGQDSVVWQDSVAMESVAMDKGRHAVQKIGVSRRVEASGDVVVVELASGSYRFELSDPRKE